MQAVARRVLATKAVDGLFRLRGELRRVLEATEAKMRAGQPPDDNAISQVETILARAARAPVRLREETQLNDKFKIILKRRLVASKLDAMAERTIDQIDDEFVSVCLAAQELGFTVGNE